MSHVRTTITMLVLLGIVVGASWWAWTTLQDGRTATEEPAATPSMVCTTPPPKKTTAKKVLVSVYNAGAPTGTGGEVMDALNRRGFKRGEIDVAPHDANFDGVVVWTPKPQSAAVQLVVKQFRRARILDRPNPPGPGVNVMVGSEFESLKPKAPRQVTVASSPECTPAGDGDAD